MVTIQIGSDTRRLEEIDDAWITQQINNRQKEGLPVCVVVTIKAGDLDVRLATPDCGSGTPGGRPPRPDEARIIDLWIQHRLGSNDFSGGNLVAFIKRLRRFL